MWVGVAHLVGSISRSVVVVSQMVWLDSVGVVCERGMPVCAYISRHIGSRCGTVWSVCPYPARSSWRHSLLVSPLMLPVSGSG